MSKYTLELRYLYEDKKFNLFDFPYNLYDNDLKPWFGKILSSFYVL